MRPRWLMWINPDNRAQLAWVEQYLTRKGYNGIAFLYRQSQDGAAFIEAMERHGQDQAFRRWMDKMRAAWRQKQYRTRNGQQTTFQLEKKTQADLSRLAKAQGQTKVETLRQLISETAQLQNQIKNEAKKAKDEVNNAKEKHKQERATDRQLVDTLLDALAEEIDRRCCLEASFCEWGNSSLGWASIGDYLTLIDKRVSALQASLADARLMRIKDASLQERMGALAESHGVSPWKPQQKPSANIA